MWTNSASKSPGIKFKNGQENTAEWKKKKELKKTQQGCHIENTYAMLYSIYILVYKQCE